MPIYEYQCDTCGHQLETLQKISDAPLKTCPECHKDSLRKRVSAAAFRLKGSGWYETDFKNKPKPAGKQDGKASGGSESGKDSGGSGKTGGSESKSTDTKSGGSKDSSSSAA